MGKFSCYKKMEKIQQEIYNTEKTYVEGLNLLYQEFVVRMEKEKDHAAKYNLKKQDFEKMVSNIPTLHNLHNVFFDELQSIDLVNIAAVMKKYINAFKNYRVYMNGFEECAEVIDKCKKNKKGEQLIEEINNNMKIQGGQNI